MSATLAPAMPAATLSVDLDNLWCYQRSFGLAGWQNYPSFVERALPRLLEVLDGLDLRVTLFIIGRDAERAPIRALLREAVERGHEAGNHSYDHDPQMNRWPAARIRDEVARAGAAVEAATGQRPRGFRGPAYAMSPALLEALVSLGYAYDASSFPNSVGTIARAYHRKRLATAADAASATPLYGSMADAWQPLRPYLWTLAQRELVEVPVTTLPLLRVPFHGTYLHHLADRSPRLAAAYFRTALGLCRLRGVPPSFLLHLTDVLGCDDCPDLDYLPGMRRSGAEKAVFLADLLTVYRKRFQGTPLGDYVVGLTAGRRLDRVPLVAAA
ncbi:MAG: polysaccharide deacetylase family protein [Kiloniellaceae bacterium]